MGSYFRKTDDRIQCLLCPHLCKIAEGKTGICGIRKNIGSGIELMTYGVVSGYSLDPVEKKPLYHFYPGHNILSIGSFGCNMRCDFCQNYHISQSVPRNLKRQMMPDELVQAAKVAESNIGMAFTYNEPVIWLEFMRDVAEKVRQAGLKTVMVSNGYVMPEPLTEMTGFIDAFNIDLKSFNNSSYLKLTGARLDPVLESLKIIAESGRHLEITSLIIPGFNDTVDEMAQQAGWIAGELGATVPLHLSRYFPMFRRNDPATSRETLRQLYHTASERLRFVYLGNMESEQLENTRCPGCGNTVTYRSGYSTRIADLDSEGRCLNCGTLIYSNFTFSSQKGH